MVIAGVCICICTGLHCAGDTAVAQAPLDGQEVSETRSRSKAFDDGPLLRVLAGGC